MENFKRTVRDVNISGRAVFLRVAYDLPLDMSKDIRDPARIADDSRIADTLPTIQYILDHKPSKFLIAAGWQGRPDGEDAGMSMAAASMKLKELLGKANYGADVLLAPSCLDGSSPRSVYRNQAEVRKAVDALKPGQILMFENVRYDREANRCDEKFAIFMASLAGRNAVYVNEAEAQNHRPEATIKLLPKLIVDNNGDAVFGFKYFEVMDKIGSIGRKLKEPGRGPFVFYLSGKKIEVQTGITSKITVAHALLDSMQKGDTIIVQGAVAYTFILAKEFYAGIEKNADEMEEKLRQISGKISNETKNLDSNSAAIHEEDIRKETNEGLMLMMGVSKTDISRLIGSSYRKKGQEAEQMYHAYRVMAKAREKGVNVLMASDHIIASTSPNKQGILPKEAEIKVFSGITGIPEGWMGVAPGPKTLHMIENAYKGNYGISLQAGPVQIEDSRVEEFSHANMRIGKATREAKERGWITIAAGGDTVAETSRYGNGDAYTLISNAGGATLELVESGTSVGIEALRESYTRK